MPLRRWGTACVLALGLALASCAADRTGQPAESDPPAATDVPLGAHREDELARAAEDVVTFLRGEGGFDRIRLADTVTLYLAPEGGGSQVRVARDQLRDPSAWVIRTMSGESAVSLAPPPGRQELTTRVGRHFNCLEYPLPAEFDELARLPHVGTKLQPPGAGSCLQSWNLTLVFDPVARPPTLVAAVYDQWEW